MLTTVTHLDGSSVCLCHWAVDGGNPDSLELLEDRALSWASNLSSSPAHFTHSLSGPSVLQDVLFGFLEAVLSTGDMQPVPRLSEQ